MVNASYGRAINKQWNDLLGYPKSRWGKPPDDRWLLLCNQLQTYAAPLCSFAIGPERKWELVSALQKSIRRGEKQVALRMVSAMNSIPEASAYFWRRLCVIACEDVGPADDVLVAFVVACATSSPARKNNNDIWCFLVEQMCDLAARSRIYCSMSVVEAAATKAQLPQLSVEEARVASAVERRASSIAYPSLPWEHWLKKNGWRAEGLLKFLDLRLSGDITHSGLPVPSYKLLFELPSYAFDMHTRPGMTVLKSLFIGIDGTTEIRDLIQAHRVYNPTKALGDALFFVEGARIRNELIYPVLCGLEQRVLAQHHGLSHECWQNLCSLVEAGLRSGLIDKIREEILTKLYENCPMDYATEKRLFDKI
jgi:hypothetical protein